MGKQGKEYVAVVAGRALVSFALGGGQSTQANIDSALPAQTQLPEGASRDLVQKTCSTCHSVDRFTSSRLNRSEWTNTVQRMAQYGASASDEEFNAIIDYLTKNYGAASGNGSANGTGSMGNAQPVEPDAH
jgi:cytochrome c5